MVAPVDLAGEVQLPNLACEAIDNAILQLKVAGDPLVRLEIVAQGASNAYRIPIVLGVAAPVASAVVQDPAHPIGGQELGQDPAQPINPEVQQ
jgi:hypothetical protein